VPTYEYACKQCGKHLDVVQKFTDEPLTTCPSCAGTLRKVFGSIGISFKGSGFYKNDSRTTANGDKGDKSEKGDKKEPAASDSGTSSGSESPTAPKTDAPAAKTEATKADSPKDTKPKSDKGASTAAAS